jgi:uracil-DNA glycosylase
MTAPRSPERGGGSEEHRFRSIFRTLHRDHATCLDDEWLMRPCAERGGIPLGRPWIWSRRNGPWRRVPVLWVGAAPGNAGGRGRGSLGAHGTRIPFGGDVAGANLEVLLGSIGLQRNETFIVAALNRLPDRGGGEPTTREIREPAGGYRDSIALLRDTINASGPTLVVALGNVAARAIAAAWLRVRSDAGLPSLAVLAGAGWSRNAVLGGLAAFGAPSPAFAAAWTEAWGDATPPDAIWLTHPSAQNMSPFAGEDTTFHKRMLEARDALRRAARTVLGVRPPARRPPLPSDGIYALPEWRGSILPRLTTMDGLWRQRGV